MSDEGSPDVLGDLRRWVEQERAAGRERVFFDPAHARAAATRSRPAPQEPAVPAPRRAAATASAAVSAPVAAAAGPGEETAPLARAAVRRDPATMERKAAALAALDASAVSVCTKCPLHRTRTKTVFGVGHPDADVVFVGEAPGADEDAQGEPFVGRAGQLLTKILQAIGFEREDVYIANVLKCRPPNNRDPLPEEVAHCEPYLLKQLAILEPKVICALGRISAQTLLQTRDSLTKLRGQVHDYHGIPMVVTYHPAALLRNPSWKRPTWDDVRRLRQLYDELRGD